MNQYAPAGENWAEKPASNAYCPSGLGELANLSENSQT